MNSQLRAALDRTLLLMRDDLIPDVDDASLISALTETSVVLVADSKNLSSHSAQCAYVTAALLLARSGHRVHVVAPDVALVGTQVPLKGIRLVSALLEVGRDLLPGIELSPNPPNSEVSLVVAFGDSPQRFRARRSVAVRASAWSAHLGSVFNAERWDSEDWPFGGLCAGTLVAAEAMKAAMHRLRAFAKSPVLFDELYAYADRLTFDLAPADTPRTAMLGVFDFVSGGAITNATLYVLTRILDARGQGRVVEPEASEVSNLNRYAYFFIPRSVSRREGTCNLSCRRALN